MRNWSFMIDQRKDLILLEVRALDMCWNFHQREKQGKRQTYPPGEHPRARQISMHRRILKGWVKRLNIYLLRILYQIFPRRCYAMLQMKSNSLRGFRLLWLRRTHIILKGKKDLLRRHPNL